MNKIFIISFCFSMTVSLIHSQNEFKCGHNEKKMNHLISHKKNKSEDYGSKSDEYVIPIVFHILHVNGPENISDEQIYSAIQALNEDFNRQNADRINVVPAFENNIADVGIVFKLAKLDPNGDSTTGINRIYTTLTNHGWEDSSKINQWPPHKYLNIWVSKSLDGNAAAYSWYPSYADVYPELDGIMQQYDYTGFVGTGSETVRHVLTHEVGHYFNLKHTSDDVIGNGPCGDDEVADTPITQPSECDLNLSVCNPPIIENVQNFMTGCYSFLMFAEGQKQRMIDCLNSSEGGRNNLWQEQNLIETGLLEHSANISTISKSKFTIYPNPATSELIISFESHKDELILSDLLGKTIPFNFKTENNQMKIDVSGLPAGTYFVRSNDWNEKLIIYK